MDDFSKVKACVLCGRSGTRGFILRKWFMGPKVGRAVWICKSGKACNKRRRQGGPDVRRHQAAERDPIRHTGGPIA